LRHRITYANAWVLRVDGARRLLPSYVALPIAIATVVLAMTGAVRIYGLIAGAATLSPILDRVLQYLCVMGLFYLVAWGALAWEGRKAVDANGTRLQSVVLGALLGAGGFGVAAGGAALLNAVVPAGQIAPLDHRLLGLALGAAFMAFQAYGEELFFRGWLQPNLATRWGPWIGVCCTSVLFAVAHAIGRPISPLALINDGIAGLAFGLLAMRSGGLLAPFLAHFFWNWIEASWLGMTPNPGVDPLGSMFDYDLVGPALLGGGPDALNASATTSLALLLMIGVALLWRPHRSAAAV
jgi:membrane protease YdiL (CAAX protease family)